MLQRIMHSELSVKSFFIDSNESVNINKLELIDLINTFNNSGRQFYCNKLFLNFHQV